MGGKERLAFSTGLNEFVSLLFGIKCKRYSYLITGLERSIEFQENETVRF
jgi:hypothetical protein